MLIADMSLQEIIMTFHITVGSSDTITLKQLLFQYLVDLSRYLKVICVCKFDFRNLHNRNLIKLVRKFKLQSIVCFHFYDENWTVRC